MPNHVDLTSPGIDNDKINNRMLRDLANYKKTYDYAGEPVKEIEHRNPNTGGKRRSLVSDGPLMTFTQMLEAMDEIAISYSHDSMGNEKLNDGPDIKDPKKEQELIAKLDELYTSILIMQGYEDGVSSEVKESFEEADVLTERNIIQFDDSTRMAQLLSICALLIQQQKNTENYQMYIKASKLRNEAKLNMQREEYAAAKALAQKYLVHVSTSNASSAARDAAMKLLPQTQH